ncbi:hypothetical protein [Marinomonas sp. FW-1]|uniref:hypothetical protein n=1 Tax=Marinomonas sp. FW-1 TaxID=2071621 RepID=UPI0015860A04|nr:hypothetical protein [Marinomonas sp. FW-1]
MSQDRKSTHTLEEMESARDSYGYQPTRTVDVEKGYSPKNVAKPSSDKPSPPKKD